MTPESLGNISILGGKCSLRGVKLGMLGYSSAIKTNESYNHSLRQLDKCYKIFMYKLIISDFWDVISYCDVGHKLLWCWPCSFSISFTSPYSFTSLYANQVIHWTFVVLDYKLNHTKICNFWNSLLAPFKTKSRKPNKRQPTELLQQKKKKKKPTPKKGAKKRKRVPGKSQYIRAPTAQPHQCIINQIRRALNRLTHEICKYQ